MENNVKKREIFTGTVHNVPDDLKQVLASSPAILKKWNKLTPLARNEWICWITVVKKLETREKHLDRLQEDLLKEKKRPCCWAGCPHRKKEVIKPQSDIGKP